MASKWLRVKFKVSDMSAQDEITDRTLVIPIPGAQWAFQTPIRAITANGSLWVPGGVPIAWLPAAMQPELPDYIYGMVREMDVIFSLMGGGPIEGEF